MRYIRACLKMGFFEQSPPNGSAGASPCRAGALSESGFQNTLMQARHEFSNV
jgi:hypothetical protein